MQIKQDQQIKNEILSRLSLDSRIDTSKVRVDVNRGVVTLKGMIPSLEIGMVVVGLASDKKEVIKLDNRLEIAHPTAGR